MRKEWRPKEKRPPGLEEQGKGASSNRVTHPVDGGNTQGSGSPPRMDGNDDDKSSASKWRGAEQEAPSPLSPATPSTPKPRRRRRRRRKRNNTNGDSSSFNSARPLEVEIGILSSLPSGSRRKEVQIGEKCIEAIVTADSQVAEQWVRRQTGKLFGMDLEWKPNFVKGQDNRAALLQLCGDRDCLILQLFYLDAVPPSLLRLLKDHRIGLAGVEISSDAGKLAVDYGFVCGGLVDLPTLAVDRLGRPDLKHAGLKALAAQVLGLSLAKPKRITVSNWQNTQLSSSQIDYACTDAYVSFAIARKLMEDH